MSIESDSEFFEIGRFSCKYRPSFGEGVSSSVFDVDDEKAGVSGQPDSCSGLSEDEGEFEELKDDFDSDWNDFDSDLDLDFEDLAEPPSAAEFSDIGVLSYDYEMDTVDTLNLVDQINAYTSDFWEFVSIAGDFILFKRPKYASSNHPFAL